MNDNRAASVRANMECDFEASLYGKNEILYFTYACRQNIYVRSTDSERKSASSACYIHFINARKSVRSGSVFSLSFGPFLSLFIATKEKEKDISKTFLLQNNSYFFFFEKARRKSKQKEETFIVFYALTSVVQMDAAGKPALSRSLKNARGANVVQF